MSNLVYYQRNMESKSVAVPPNFTTTMQTVNEEINGKEFGKKKDGTPYDHSQKAKVIMGKLIHLYEEMDKPSLEFEKKDEPFQHSDISQIQRDIVETKKIIVALLGVWAPMVFAILDSDMQKKYNDITIKETFGDVDLSSMAVHKIKAATKEWREITRESWSAQDGAYLVGESQEKNDQRIRQEEDFRQLSIDSNTLEAGRFSQTKIIARGCIKVGDLVKKASKMNSNLAILYTNGTVEIANEEKASDQMCSSGSESSLGTLSSAGLFSSKSESLEQSDDSSLSSYDPAELSLSSLFETMSPDSP